MKRNCTNCGHFKDNHAYGERTDDPEKIGHCMERNCDCDQYEATSVPTYPRTDDQIVEDFDLEFSEVVEEFPDGSTIRKGVNPQMLDWLRSTLTSFRETVVAEERERNCDIIANQCSFAMEHGKSEDIRRFASSLANRLYAVINNPDEDEALTPPKENHK